MGREIVSIATALVPYPPERVWAVVTDLDCWQWRSDLSRLDHVGEDAFTEYDRSGFPTRFTVTERRPLSRWAFDLDNANLAGRWAGEFRPEGGGTQVTFTETITVKSPGCASLPRATSAASRLGIWRTWGGRWNKKEGPEMKRRLTKLTAAGLAVLALTGCIGGAQEEVSEEPPVPKNVETTWTLVVGQPEGSTCWDAAESFAEALSDATEGAVAVEVQPRPLDRVASLEQAAAGIVDLYLDSSFVYGSYGDEEELGRPFFSVTMPFLFPDAETAAEVLDSTGGEALNGVLAELGLRGLAYGELGFRYLTADRPVTTPEDLEGLRIRTAGLLELFESYIGCWGVRLYPSSYSDVMTPLSNGTYNGQESTLAEADAAGYQTVQTDVTIFPAFYEPAILTMNSDLYDSLSPDLREAVDRCGREAMADQRLRNREQEAEILERWQEEDGIAVHVLTEEQWGAFQALTERLYDPEDPDHQDWFADCTPEWVDQFRPS